jgi:flavorubredoxin
VIGDTRDYHLHLPELASRLNDIRPGDSVDLGGGYVYFVLPAPVKDLASSVWGYEARTRVMFVGDGFAYVHPNPLEGLADDGDQELDVAVHRPGECDLFSEELKARPLDVDRAKWITRAALSWSRYVDASPMFEEVDDLLNRYPTEMIAPAHGNVISNPIAVLPVIREAFELAYADG